MIENTFRIVPSVGAKKERGIWDSGVLTWNDFIASRDVRGISPASKERYDSLLNVAYSHLDEDDSVSLGDMLPRGEQWRLYGRFGERAAFLDIETDGLDRNSEVTVITVHKRGETLTLVNGIDLDAETISNALEGSSMIVTFNGSCFDVPVLKNSFPALDLDMPHFDLRFGCRKVGYTGGLKNIEHVLGLSRDCDIESIGGMDAVRLWKQWTRAGDERSLDLLVRYNRADTVNLKTLAGITYKKLVREHAGFVH